MSIALVSIGNLLGSLFVAYFFADQDRRDRLARPGGHAGADLRRAWPAIATGKALTETRLADLPARRRLQLAGLPRGLAGARGRRHRRQDPRHLLPDHGVRRHGLRPRRRQHVLPARRDLRRTSPASAGATCSTTGCSPFLGNLVGAAVFVAGLLVPVPARHARSGRGPTVSRSRSPARSRASRPPGASNPGPRHSGIGRPLISDRRP